MFSIYDGNVPEHFKQFKEDIENYFIATESYEKTNLVQVARLKNLMDKETLKLYNYSLAKYNGNETVQSIIDTIGEYCLPKKEIIDVFN